MDVTLAAGTAVAVVIGRNMCRNRLSQTYDSSHKQLIESFKHNIKANIKLNKPELDKLIQLFKLSANYSFDIGSYIIDQYESKCLKQSNIPRINQFIQTLKFPKKLCLKNDTINRSLLEKYVQVHSLIYKPLSLKSTICVEMYNIKIIIKYIKCINDNICKLYKLGEDSVQFNIKFVPNHLKFSVFSIYLIYSTLFL